MSDFTPKHQVFEKRARLEEIVDQLNELLHMSSLPLYEHCFGNQCPMIQLDRMLEDAGGLVADVHMCGEAAEAMAAKAPRPVLTLTPKQ